MKVLVACEFSGIVRDAFLARGHDAISCDLLPTERPGPHYQGDVRDILGDGFDLMVAHPPCTYLSSAANACWEEIGRDMKRKEAMEFFWTLAYAPIEKICIENPVGLPNRAFRKPDQIIHPYYFGDAALKRTCLWLKNLPLLDFQIEEGLFAAATACAKPTPLYIGPSGKRNNFVESLGSNSKERSRTFQGIADAMAEQWGILDEKEDR